MSGRKGNQTTKFGQLIEYNMRNIFLEKSYTKYGEETIPRPFSKKSKIVHISGYINYSFTPFVLIVFQVEGYRNILKLAVEQLLLPRKF